MAAPHPNDTRETERDLLAALFAASAELRFHIKSLNIERVEQNPSCHRHTEIMRRVEKALKSGN